MNKSIWHTPDEKPETNRSCVFIGDAAAINYLSPIDDWEDLRRTWGVERWSYYDELLALESKLFKAVENLETAVDILDGFYVHYDFSEDDYIEYMGIKTALKDIGEQYGI